MTAPPAPIYRYPDTYAERVAWHERGTPAPFAPYTPEAPDAYRDGLALGYRLHMERLRCSSPRTD
jgi:hypothetical protein